MIDDERDIWANIERIIRTIDQTFDKLSSGQNRVYPIVVPGSFNVILFVVYSQIDGSRLFSEKVTSSVIVIVLIYWHSASIPSEAERFNLKWTSDVQLL